MRSKLFKIITVLLLITLFSVKTVNMSVNASTPYKTYTLDRYGELVETQDAYDPIKSVKTFEIDGKNETIKGAEDLFIDDDDYLYLADTGNQRVVIMDKDFKYISKISEYTYQNDNGEDVATKLIKPMGIFVRDEFIYVADYGDEKDNKSGAVVVFEFDKTTNEVSFVKRLGSPSSPLLQIDGFLFRPQKIAVDKNHTMYIVSKGSSNGILLVNNANRFLNFFAPNRTTGTLWDSFLSFFYGDNENVVITKKIPPAPTNVMLNDSGYIYTVTSTVVQNDINDAIKKVNIGGVNFYPEDMEVASSFTDSWASDYNTVYSLTSDGFIYEYDTEGNLLFKFAGRINKDEQLGLFNKASSIATDAEGKLYVVDPNSNNIQVFRKTEFTSKVHLALKSYMSGQYVESEDLWLEVLRYNSMFDLAHKAIGLARYMEGDYEEAMVKFKDAYDKENYSEAFWEVRNAFLMENLVIIFIIVAACLIVVAVLHKLHKKYGIFNKPIAFAKKVYAKKPVRDGLIFFKFIRHPYDTIYEIRHDKSIKVYNGFIMLGLVFVVYLLFITKTNFIFNNVVLEKTILLKECTKIILPIILFVVANYLVSSLMDGEGSLRCIFMNTMGSLIPVVIMLPFIVLITNGLTFNEAFIYYFAVGIMLAWTAILLIANIKETHNYTMGQTIANLFITVLMMLIIIIVIILVYLLVSQIFGFGVDLFKEVMF